MTTTTEQAPVWFNVDAVMPEELRLETEEITNALQVVEAELNVWLERARAAKSAVEDNLEPGELEMYAAAPKWLPAYGELCMALYRMTNMLMAACGDNQYHADAPMPRWYTPIGQEADLD